VCAQSACLRGLVALDETERHAKTQELTTKSVTNPSRFTSPPQLIGERVSRWSVMPGLRVPILIDGVGRRCVADHPRHTVHGLVLGALHYDRVASLVHQVPRHTGGTE